MTLMELAIAGFGAVVIGTVALELLAVRRGDARVTMAGWGALIAVAALGYQLRLLRLPTAREATILAWICIWAASFARDVWRQARQPLPVPARGAAGRVLRVSIETFCGSLPFLLVLSDATDDGWTWPETAALVLAGLGVALLAASRRPSGRTDRHLLLGYVISFAAVYALAFDAAAGALALYSVYVVARKCKQVFDPARGAERQPPARPASVDLPVAPNPSEAT